MLLKLIFTLFFLFTAIAVGDYQMTNCNPPPKPLPRPAPGKPLTVNISTEIIALSLDEEKQEFNVTFYLKQEWKDPRLTFRSKNNTYRKITDRETIWTPDLFFVNDISNEMDNNEDRNISIKSFPNGRLVLVERRTVRVPCLVNLRIYPFDTQICQVEIESYGYETHDMIVQWNKTGREAVARRLTHETIAFMDPVNEITSLRGVTHSSPRMIFTLSRTSVTVICRVILPIAVIALSSWISFFFCWDEILIRVSLWVSPILTYTLHIYFSTAFFLSPMYLTDLDVWAATSLAALIISGAECIYTVCRKRPRDDRFESVFQNPNSKYRVMLALFVACLDTLSIVCILLTKLP